MACNDVWIVTDFQNFDKLQELNALRNSATKRPEIAAWHIFHNYDIFSHQGQDEGNSLYQLIDGISTLLTKRKRLPHTLLICMGDQLLQDEELMQDLDQINRIIAAFSRKIVRMISNWMAALPHKAKPERMPRIYITKPLPVPQKFFQTRQRVFEKKIRDRKLYIAELVKAVKAAHIGFINANITHDDGELFEQVTSAKHKGCEKFVLNPRDLTTYWKNISQNLYNLAWDATAHTRTADENSQETAQEQQTVFKRLGDRFKSKKNFNFHQNNYRQRPNRDQRSSFKEHNYWN